MTVPGLAVVGVCTAASLSPAMTVLGRTLVLVPAVVAAGFGGLAVFRFGSLQRPAARVAIALSRPVALGAGLFATGLGLAVFAGVKADADLEAECDAVPPIPHYSPTSLKEATGVKLRTDRGRAVPVSVYVPTPGLEEDDTHEKAYAQRFADRLIRRTSPDPNYNCHGFTFTDGKYWVNSSSVDMILVDNGYLVVKFPRIGDVAVYRDSNGTISHTGVVRTVLSGGMVLVESKWGRLGRFLHPHTDQPYPGSCEFYHSARMGRLLLGLPRPLPPTPFARPS
jgi:hypothetical protein